MDQFAVAEQKLSGGVPETRSTPVMQSVPAMQYAGPDVAPAALIDIVVVPPTPAMQFAGPAVAPPFVRALPAVAPAVVRVAPAVPLVTSIDHSIDETVTHQEHLRLQAMSADSSRELMERLVMFRDADREFASIASSVAAGTMNSSVFSDDMRSIASSMIATTDDLKRKSRSGAAAAAMLPLLPPRIQPVPVFSADIDMRSIASSMLATTDDLKRQSHFGAAAAMPPPVLPPRIQPVPVHAPLQSVVVGQRCGGISHGTKACSDCGVEFQLFSERRAESYICESCSHKPTGERTRTRGDYDSLLERLERKPAPAPPAMVPTVDMSVCLQCCTRPAYKISNGIEICRPCEESWLRMRKSA